MNENINYRTVPVLYGIGNCTVYLKKILIGTVRLQLVSTVYRTRVQYKNNTSIVPDILNLIQILLTFVYLLYERIFAINIPDIVRRLVQRYKTFDTPNLRVCVRCHEYHYS